MFPQRFFPYRYFPRRYFPESAGQSGPLPMLNPVRTYVVQADNTVIVRQNPDTTIVSGDP